MRRSRVIKGAAVSGLAAAACFWVWTAARTSAQATRGADPDSLYAGSIESLFATVVGVVLMPVLLWIGMRALRERGTELLVGGATVAWLFIGGHVVEDDVSAVATVAFLALFALLGGVLAAASSDSS